jgi:hypothetical protein
MQGTGVTLKDKSREIQGAFRLDPCQIIEDDEDDFLDIDEEDLKAAMLVPSVSTSEAPNGAGVATY